MEMVMEQPELVPAEMGEKMAVEVQPLREGEFEMNLVHFSFTESKDGNFAITSYFEDVEKKGHQFSANVDVKTFQAILKDIKETKCFIGMKPKVVQLQSIRRNPAPSAVVPMEIVEADCENEKH